jgi:hypothetical protein
VPRAATDEEKVRGKKSCLASDELFVARRFADGNDVYRIDGVRNLVFVNNDNHLRRERDKVPVRHQKLPPVGQLQSKRLKPVPELVPDLLYEHATDYRAPETESSVTE